jgi:hypothetical protein
MEQPPGLSIVGCFPLFVPFPTVGNNLLWIVVISVFGRICFFIWMNEAESLFYQLQTWGIDPRALLHSSVYCFHSVVLKVKRSTKFVLASDFKSGSLCTSINRDVCSS